MNVYINGQLQQTQAQFLAELVEELGLQGKRIAVEIDEQLIPKGQHATTVLKEHIVIEIIQAVGGG